MKKISISDVAKQAGVSKATVSLVLNNKESGIRISEKTRLNVLQAAKDLNYQPNYGARLLSTGKSCMIGVLTLNENSLFLSDYDARIMRGISAITHKSGYHIMILDEEIIRRKSASFGGNLVTGDFLDGILIFSPDAKNQYLSEIVDTIADSKIPFVYIWRKGSDRPASVVMVNNVKAAEAGTEYLISLGHRRIGFVSLGERSLSGRERLQGYSRALASHGIPLDEKLIRYDIFRSFAPEKMSDESRIYDLMDQPDPPTALFVVFDPLAISVMKVLQNRGISVPEDVSVLGFGNVMMSAYFNPALSTMNEPLEEFGRHAAQLLLAQIENKEERGNIKEVVLNAELIVRESCRKI